MIGGLEEKGLRFLLWSVLGLAVLHCAGLFLGRWSWQFERLFFMGFESNFTTWFSSMLWFLVFGLAGGAALGALNGRKAKTQAKYKNEYTSYFGMAMAGIILLGVYYSTFGEENIRLPADSEFSNLQVLFFAMISGFLALFGVGLTAANMLAE